MPDKIFISSTVAFLALEVNKWLNHSWMKKTNQNFTRSQQINFGNKLISKVAIWCSDCWLLLTLNEVVNELADWGAGLKCLCNSRGDLAGRQRIDKPCRSSLHIQADSWARGRAGSQRGGQRWCVEVRCSQFAVFLGSVEGAEAVGFVIYAATNIADWFEIGCQGMETWRGK